MRQVRLNSNALLYDLITSDALYAEYKLNNKFAFAYRVHEFCFVVTVLDYDNVVCSRQETYFYPEWFEMMDAIAPLPEWKIRVKEMYKNEAS